MIRFFIQLTSLTGVLAGIIMVLEGIPSLHWTDNSVWKMLILLVTITIISRTINFIGLLRKPDERLLFSFASIGLHFLLSLASVTILIQLGVENKILFFFNFLALYFCYTLFDIYTLIPNLHENSQKGDFTNQNEIR
ncbi:MAG: hypothetical protein GY827_07475 [Cytophagales bacterium]|nr:hypothetical protein [Cytophagales bacterium]